MNYAYAISNALEAAKVRIDYYQQSQNSRYLEEASDWIQVASIYMQQETQSVSSSDEDFLESAA